MTSSGKDTALPMEDGRTFIRVHDGMPDHPKVEPLSDKAFRLLIETWCWCSRQRTDGHVPAAVWRKRGTPAARRELVTARLVADLGQEGVQVHDYLKHNRSRAQIDEFSASKAARRSEAALKANHARWHVGEDGTPSADCRLCHPDSDSAPTGSGSDP